MTVYQTMHLYTAEGDDELNYEAIVKLEKKERDTFRKAVLGVCDFGNDVDTMLVLVSAHIYPYSKILRYVFCSLSSPYFAYLINLLFMNSQSPIYVLPWGALLISSLILWVH